MLLSGLKRFLNGTKANANEVNQNFDLITNALNGNLGAENIADKSLTKEKMAFALASDKFLGSVASFGDLATTFPTPRHCDTAIVEDEVAQYMYNETKMKWEKSSGTVATVSHGTLSGRDGTDQHPISAITGLESRLSTIEGDVTSLETVDTNFNAELADHEDRISTNEADISAINTKNTSQDTSISTLQTDVGKKFDKTGGDITGDVKIKKSVPVLTFDSGHANVPKIWFNGNSTNDFGFFHDSGLTAILQRNSDKKILASRDKTNYYEMLDMGNFSAYFDSLKVVDAFDKADGDTALPTATYTKIPFDGSGNARWSDTNDEYTVPKDGDYKITASIGFTAISIIGASLYIKAVVNGTTDYFLNQKEARGTSDSLSSARVIKGLKTGDKITLQAYVSTGTASVRDSNWTHLIIERV